MSHEREIAEEQEFLDVALSALDHMRQGARSLRDSAAVANMRGAGDLVERDVVMGTALHRLDQLAIGDQPLFFGRIDYQANGNGSTTAFNIGFTPTFPSALLVHAGGLLQRLTTDYTFSGTT